MSKLTFIFNHDCFRKQVILEKLRKRAEKAKRKVEQENIKKAKEEKLLDLFKNVSAKSNLANSLVGPISRRLDLYEREI